MIKKKVQDALNRQINREMYSSYLYLAMAAYFDSLGLKGCSGWMKVQVKEEMIHAMKMYNYLMRENARVILWDIEAPPEKWKSPLDVFKNVLKHEQKVTGLINKLVSVSIKEKDEKTKQFMQWYVKEQVEEEESAGNAVEKIKKAGINIAAADSEFAKRVFKPPKQEII
jgi:ferritin